MMSFYYQLGSEEKEKERLSSSAFLGTEDIGVHIVLSSEEQTSVHLEPYLKLYRKVVLLTILTITISMKTR